MTWWNRTAEPPAPDLPPRVHVLPLADLREHVSDASCWCRPTQDEEEPAVWTHHALDGRESYELGRPMQ